MGLLYSPFSFQKRRALWIFWAVTLLLVFLLAVLIFLFSAANDKESSSLSGGLCYSIVRFFYSCIPGLASHFSMEELVLHMEYPIRKLAHFSEYAFLAICTQCHVYAIYRLAILPQKSWQSYKKHVLSGVFFCVIYACSDEIHQYFVPGRACRILDVMIDSSGVIFGTLVFGILFLRLLDVLFRKGYNEEKLEGGNIHLNY